MSEHTLTRALDVLEAEGYIIRHRRTTATGRPATTIYEVVFQQEAGGKAQGAAPTTGAKVTPAKIAPTLTTPPLPNPATATDRAELEVSAKIEPDQAIMHPADTAILHLTDTAILHRTKENLKQKKLLIQHTNTQPVEKTQNPAESSGGCVCVADEVKEPNTGTQTGLQSGIGPELKQVLPSIPPVLSKPFPVQKEKLEPELRPELTGLVEEFCRQRISQKLALELAPLALANGHGPGYVAQLQAYLATLRGVKNPQGFLIHLVRTNWQPGVSVSAGAWPGSGREPGLGLGAHAGDGGGRSSGSGSGGEESALWDRAALEARYGPDIVRELPTSVTAEKLPRVLEMYPRMIREATSQRERLGYEAKLERYCLLGRQMGLLAAEDQGDLLPQPVPVAQAGATPLPAPPWMLPGRPNSNPTWPKNSPTHPFNPAQVQAQMQAQTQAQVQGGSYAAN